MCRGGLTGAYHFNPPYAERTVRRSHSSQNLAPLDLFSLCFLLFLCSLLTDTHTWLKSVHYQRDAAGWNEAGLIAAIEERMDVVHAKKNPIHKCTGRRSLLQHMFDSLWQKKNDWENNMRKGCRQEVWSMVFSTSSCTVNQILSKVKGTVPLGVSH